MTLDLTDAFKYFGQVFEKELATKLDESAFADLGCKPKSLLNLVVQYKVVSDGVEVQASGHIDLDCACARCAREFVLPLDIDIDELFVQKNSEEDGEHYVYSQNVLDLDKCVIDAILLSLPTVLLCCEDCKGLCPHCYANLNEVKCECEEQ